MSSRKLIYFKVSYEHTWEQSLNLIAETYFKWSKQWNIEVSLLPHFFYTEALATDATEITHST